EPINNMPYLEDESNRQIVSNILSELNTGISDIIIEEITEEQFTLETDKRFSSSTLELIKDRFDKNKKTNKEEKMQYIVRGDVYYRFTIDENEKIQINTIRLNH